MAEQILTLRQRFERWYSDDGKSPKAVERDGRGGYLLLQTANAWTVWQAADESAQIADGVDSTRGWPVNQDAEPVPFPKLPPAIVMHPQLGELFDRLQMQTYAMGYAMACGNAGVTGGGNG